MKVEKVTGARGVPPAPVSPAQLAKRSPGTGARVRPTAHGPRDSGHRSQGLPQGATQGGCRDDVAEMPVLKMMLKMMLKAEDVEEAAVAALLLAPQHLNKISS